MTVEAGPFPANAGADVRTELRKRVWKVEERLFMMVEVPVQTPFTLDVMFDRLEELAAGLDSFAYIVDLSGVRRPDARVRERLRQRVGMINHRLIHVAVVIGGNAVLRAVAKLTAFSVGFRSFSFHQAADEAMEACRRALG